MAMERCALQGQGCGRAVILALGAKFSQEEPLDLSCRRSVHPQQGEKGRKGASTAAVCGADWEGLVPSARAAVLQPAPFPPDE